MRGRPTDLLTIAIAAVVAVVALPGTAAWWLIVLGAVAFAIGPRFQLRGPGGSRLDLLLLIGAAVPFLFPVPEATLGMLAAGMAAVRLSRLVGVAPPLRLAVDLRRLVGAAAYASVLFLSGVPIAIANGLGSVVLWGVAALTWFAVEVLFSLLAIRRTEATSLAYVAGVGRRYLPMIGSLMSSCAAFGLVCQFSDPCAAVSTGTPARSPQT